MSEPEELSEIVVHFPVGVEPFRWPLLTSLSIHPKEGAVILQVTEGRPIWRMAVAVQLDLTQSMGQDESAFLGSATESEEEARQLWMLHRRLIKAEIEQLEDLGFELDRKSGQVKIPRPPGKRGPREQVFTPFVGALQKWVRDWNSSVEIEDDEMREMLAPITTKIFGPERGTTDSEGKLQTAIGNTFPGAALPPFEDYSRS